MNILVINHYAGSPFYGMEYRPYFLANEWVKDGHNVLIIAASFSHLRQNQPKSIFEIIDQIKYRWVKTIEYKNNNIHRFLSMLQFNFKLIFYNKVILNNFKPDFVICSSTYGLDIFPGFYMKLKYKCKLIYELHDLWPLSPMLIGGFSKYHPFIILIQIAEDFACKHSDIYISMLSNAFEYLKFHGLDKKKYFYIPNGFSENDLNNQKDILPEIHLNVISNLKKSSKFIIGYTGGVAPSNAVLTLVYTAINMQNYDDIVFVIIGDGSKKEEVYEVVKEHNLKNVYILPSIQKSSIQFLLTFFDILYAGGTKNILHEYGTSYNKIIDYMLASKPIIFSVDDPNCLVVIANCGLRVPAEDIIEIEKGILYFKKLDPTSLEKIGNNGRDYVICNLNYNTLSKNFYNILKSIK